MDDDLLLYRGTDVATQTMRELADLGVDRLRVTVQWRGVAPSPSARTKPRSLGNGRSPEGYPLHQLHRYDHLLRTAYSLGMDVYFQVTGPAPRWAAASADGVSRPNPAEFAKFVEMLGRRYDGTWVDEGPGRKPLPRVNDWAVWNEPNRGGHLQPQWARNRKSGRVEPYAPHLYRRLVRAMTDGLRRAGHGDDLVLIGETAPPGARVARAPRASRRRSSSASCCASTTACGRCARRSSACAAATTGATARWRSALRPPPVQRHLRRRATAARGATA